ncbi:WW domain-containing oxidoreductase [Lasiosphaeris hirsuta]|uniref:WW domain-containing oxidoreductase n=1 Tax=Lasiosphaeris hirsuta TaxID=260670 RepID=A0AA40B262_9PEZI|nr:WW domain-containing oxidoreductase [Lasiosphaeris hirsuta]
MAPKYNAKTTATELTAELASEIKGKVILTTGISPGGLGAVFVSTIAQASPKLLILAGRNPAKTQETADAIAKAHPAVQTRTLQLDLGSLARVRASAAEVKAWADVPAVDVLVNNAGIMGTKYALSPEGVEAQFATNHLGHFLFANLIMAKLLAAPAPRVVSITSDGHRLGAVRFHDYNFDGGKTYNPWTAYGQSKTANMLMALSLAEKLGSRGLVAVSLHPGVIFGTSLANHMNPEEDFAALTAADKSLGNWEGWSELRVKTQDEGVATHVYGAFHPELKSHNGAYLQDAHVADPWTETVRPWGTSPVEAERLWKLSEKLVGEEFSYE